MTLAELLLKNQDAIVGRWLEFALAAYATDASAAFMRQKDPFANPIGHSLRVGTLKIFETLLGDGDMDGDVNGHVNIEKVRQDLHDIVKIRAVQQFPASEAVGFIFHLKEAVRTELPAAVTDPKFYRELVKFEGRVDQIALAAFDLFERNRHKKFPCLSG